MKIVINFSNLPLYSVVKCEAFTGIIVGAFSGQLLQNELGLSAEAKGVHYKCRSLDYDYDGVYVLRPENIKEVISTTLSHIEYECEDQNRFDISFEMENIPIDDMEWKND